MKLLDFHESELSNLIISRFSSCGHTEEGKFDHGNTCASLRGKGESKSSTESKSERKFESKSESKSSIKSYWYDGGWHDDPMGKSKTEHEKPKEKSKSYWYDDAWHSESKSKPEKSEPKQESHKHETESPGNKERDTGVTNNQVKEWQGQVKDLEKEIDDYKNTGEGQTRYVKHLEEKMHKVYDKIVAARPGNKAPESKKESEPKREAAPETKSLVDKANDAHKRMKQAKSPEERKKLKAEWESHLSELDKSKKPKAEPKKEESESDRLKNMTRDQQDKYFHDKHEKEKSEDYRGDPEQRGGYHKKAKPYNQMSSNERNQYHRSKHGSNPRRP